MEKPVHECIKNVCNLCSKTVKRTDFLYIRKTVHKYIFSYCWNCGEMYGFRPLSSKESQKNWLN